MISEAFYYLRNELFISNKCCCASHRRIRLNDVVQEVHVSMLAGQARKGHMLVARQKYLKQEKAFVRATKVDLSCKCQTLTVGQLTPEDTPDPTISQSSASARAFPPQSQLKGLSLFSGCGSFDRGLEKSGAVKFTSAVEWDPFAIHSIVANQPELKAGLFHGSVNDHFLAVKRSDKSRPMIGEIQFISSGSPCQGYSNMNQFSKSGQALQKCSLLASTLAHIELYLPEYAILENVRTMAAGENNACDQTVAALVGLGYQVRKLNLNSVDFGSSQHRRRLILIAAAPCVPLPDLPIITHGTIDSVGSDGIIGPSLKSYVPASAVSDGLNPLSNDCTINIADPDHLVPRQHPEVRRMLREIPSYPHNGNLVKAVNWGWASPATKDWLREKKFSNKSENSRTLMRIDPHGNIPTIVTKPSERDCRGGAIIHWEENRTLSLLEVRRAQGIPDDEVLVGTIAMQWKQVGNAVPRQISEALSKTIAASWAKALEVKRKSPVSQHLEVMTPKAVAKSLPKVAEVAVEETLQAVEEQEEPATIITVTPAITKPTVSMSLKLQIAEELGKQVEAPADLTRATTLVASRRTTSVLHALPNGSPEATAASSPSDLSRPIPPLMSPNLPPILDHFRRCPSACSVKGAHTTDHITTHHPFYKRRLWLCRTSHRSLLRRRSRPLRVQITNPLHQKPQAAKYTAGSWGTPEWGRRSNGEKEGGQAGG